MYAEIRGVIQTRRAAISLEAAFADHRQAILLRAVKTIESVWHKRNREVYHREVRMPAVQKIQGWLTKLSLCGIFEKARKRRGSNRSSLQEGQDALAALQGEDSPNSSDDDAAVSARVRGGKSCSFDPREVGGRARKECVNVIHRIF